MLVLFTFLESKTFPNVVPFCRINIGGIRFSERKFYNTSWHSDLGLLGSLTLHSNTAVEVFIASQAPQISSKEGE